MSQVFKRTDQLKEQIFQIKLQMDEWKVLFAADGQKSVDEIASFLELDKDFVAKTLEKFAQSGYVSANGHPVEEEADASEAVESEAAEFTGSFGDTPEVESFATEAEDAEPEAAVAEAEEETDDFAGLEDAFESLEEAESDATTAQSEIEAEDFADLEDAFKAFETDEAEAEADTKVDESELSDELESFMDEVEAEAELDLDGEETSEGDADATEAAVESTESDEDVLDFDKFFPESDEAALDEPTEAEAEAKTAETAEETDFDDIIGDLLEDEELKEAQSRG